MDLKFWFTIIVTFHLGLFVGTFVERWSQENPIATMDGQQITNETIVVSSRSDPARKPRKIIVFRHGERVDWTFENWMRTSFDRKGQYRRTDLNMPRTLPPRKSGRRGFLYDSPLTEIGKIQAELTGRNLGEAGMKIRYVYAAPPLRTVQTACSIAKGLASFMDVKVRIEPGLYEWLGWLPRRRFIEWMSPEELADAGYNIDIHYKPNVSIADLKAMIGSESRSLDSYYARNFQVTQFLASTVSKSGGDIVLVGHAATLDTCARQLTGQDPRPMWAMARELKKVSFCGLEILEEVLENQNETASNGKWRLVKPPPTILPLTHWGSHQKKNPPKCERDLIGLT